MADRVDTTVDIGMPSSDSSDDSSSSSDSSDSDCDCSECERSKGQAKKRLVAMHYKNKIP